jgi:membrane protease subunit HflC
VRKTLGLHTLADLLSAQRRQITQTIAENCGAKLAPLGIRLVDLKIRQIDYPETNLARIFDRMRSERERDAKKFRAEGEEQARTVRAEADLESQRIRAGATKRSEQLRGEGDAKAAAIYAEAYGRDPEFYGFVRSLAAYRDALDDETTVILSPNLPFLKHFFSNEKPATP